MTGLHKSDIKNPLLNWIDSRLPILTMMEKEYGQFPSPKNFNYFWNFGAIATIALLIMIATGIFLAMNYDPSTANAFNSVQHIMRDVNYGWLLRYVHMNGASLFFAGDLHSYFPRHVLRQLQGAARIAVDERRAADAADDGDGVHGLRAAVGPDELLGRHRHHQPVRRHPRSSATGS